MTTIGFNEQSRITPKANNRRNGKYVKVTLTNSQMLALNTTAIQVVPAPPSTNQTNVVQAVYATCPAQTTGATIGSATGIALKYTNSSGVTAVTIPVTGFIDQTTAQQAYSVPSSSGHLPAAGAPVVAYMAGANVTGMTGTVSLRIYYQTFPATL
jgi:hypothetical protein